MTGLAWQMIVRVFDYYCCKSNALDESVFAMSLGGWRFMVRDFALATHKSKYCKPADCDNIFIGMLCRPRPTYALKGAPLARGTGLPKLTKRFSWHTPHERFFSSLVFDTVATALYQLGSLKAYTASCRRG